MPFSMLQEREGRLAMVPSGPEQEAFGSGLAFSSIRGLSVGFIHSHRSKCGQFPTSTLPWKASSHPFLTNASLKQWER